MHDESKLKYLEFIQNIITRMNRNSFQIKAMSVTISSALLAITASNFNPLYISIVYLSLFIFWGLDAFYLSQEKGYRQLYDNIRKIDSLNEKLDFNLNLNKEYLNGKNSWQAVLLNKIIFPIYGLQALIALILLITFESFLT